jgi:hypothetical protein
MLQGKLMMSSNRTAEEWFRDAARCHVEQHQGCAWCGAAHSVHRRQEGTRLSYFCHRCDFRAGFDEQRGEYFVIPGDSRAGQTPPDTMYDI